MRIAKQILKTHYMFTWHYFFESKSLFENMTHQTLFVLLNSSRSRQRKWNIEFMT